MVVPRRPSRLFEDVPEPALSGEDERDPDGTAMRDELAAIRTMVGEVLQRQTRGTGEPPPTMPSRLFDLYLKLIGQEISEELADRIINDVRDELESFELDERDRGQYGIHDHGFFQMIFGF